MFWDFLHQPALEKRRGNIGGPISRYDFDSDGLLKVEGGRGWAVTGEWKFYAKHREVCMVGVWSQLSEASVCGWVMGGSAEAGGGREGVAHSVIHPGLLFHIGAGGGLHFLVVATRTDQK